MGGTWPGQDARSWEARDGGRPAHVHGNDIAALRDLARTSLSIHATFPLFQHLLRGSGFTAEAEKAEQGAGAASLSDRVPEAVCLIGSVERCRERLTAFSAAGVDLPILSPPIGVDGAPAVIQAFRQ